ncbi:hypothetical protein [Desulfobacula sp.]
MAKVSHMMVDVMNDETRWKTKCFNVIRVDSSCEIFRILNA